MTSLLRKKRRTIPQASAIRPTTALSVLLLCAASATGAEPPVPSARLFADLPPKTAYGQGAGAGYTPSPVPSRELAYVKTPLAMPPAPELPRYSPSREYVQGQKPKAPPVGGFALPDRNEFAQNRNGQASNQRTDPELLRKYQIFLGLPEQEQLFRLESEDLLVERMRQENRLRAPSENIKFPEKPTLSAAAYPGRALPQQAIYVEPQYVCYNRLYFQELNSERYGWDLGAIQPFVSTAVFFKDIAFLPAKIASGRPYQCSKGYCLPGDSVPYTIYPPQITLSGGLAEAATIVGLAAIFP